MFVFFILVPLAMHGYFAFRLSSRLQKSQWCKNIKKFNHKIWLATMFLFFFQISILITNRLFAPFIIQQYGYADFFYVLKYSAYLVMGIFAMMIITLIVIDVVNVFVVVCNKLIKKFFPAKSKTEKQKLVDNVDFNRRSLLASGIFITANSAIGLAEYHSLPEVIHIPLPIRNLPNNFAGLKIVQITDIHLGDLFTADYAREIVKISNNLNPDIVALTGDLVDGRSDATKAMVRPLQKLQSQHGTFMVSGNHEYYSGWDIWEREYKDLGFRVLSNENQLIKIGDEKIALCGVTDLSTRKRANLDSRYKNVIQSDPLIACKGLPTDMVKILLAHNPSDYENASFCGYDLMISGHTHGGQFFPFNLVVATIHKYYKGLYLHNDMWVYVNKGTGAWGPPMRSMVPNEITLFTLETA